MLCHAYMRWTRRIYRHYTDSSAISLDAVSPQWYQSYIYDSDGNKVETLVASGSNRIEANINDMPKHLINAFITIEDARFYSHNGIDPRGIVRAAYETIQNKFKSITGCKYNNSAAHKK